MIVARHVEHAVNHQARELFPHADAELASIAAGYVRADIDVANLRIAERERDDIRWPRMAEVPAIQARDRR